MTRTHIAIIDPSPVIRHGLQALMGINTAEYVLAGLYDDLSEFLKTRVEKLDIILLNPTIVSHYKRFNVRELLAGYPNTAIVALHYGYVNPGILAGFDGTIGIYDDETETLRKLKKIVKEFHCHPVEARVGHFTLTDREKEIVVAVAKGMTNKEIAEKYFIAPTTVVWHRQKITEKTGIKGAAGLTAYAILKNLLNTGE